MNDNSEPASLLWGLSKAVCERCQGNKLSGSEGGMGKKEEGGKFYDSISATL